MSRRSSHAFTLAEMLVAMGAFGMLSAGLFAFTSTSVRLIARNLATNHSHEAMRVSDLALLSDLHEAASPFRLIDFDGKIFTDAVPEPTEDRDALTQQLASTRANGVRYRALAGGPYQFAADAKSTDNKLKFDFGVDGKVPYVPQVGDKIVVPLLDREFDISDVPNSPGKGNTTGTIAIPDANGIGFTIDAKTKGNVTTAYFYREVAYTVFGGQLRYHANFTGQARSTYSVVRDRISSPKPFAFLYPTRTSPSDGMNLRISLEFYDNSDNARRFGNSPITLQATIPPRSRPTPVTSTNAN